MDNNTSIDDKAKEADQDVAILAYHSAMDEVMAGRLSLFNRDYYRNGYYNGYKAGYLAHEQAQEALITLLSEMVAYLDDEHPQGNRDARAINTISSTSLYHTKMKDLLTIYKNR